MLSRNIGIVLIVFSIVVLGLSIGLLVFLTNLKKGVIGTKYASLNVNAYLAITSIIMILALLSFALSVLLVIPESRLKHTQPAPFLDL